MHAGALQQAKAAPVPVGHEAGLGVVAQKPDPGRGEACVHREWIARRSLDLRSQDRAADVMAGLLS